MTEFDILERELQQISPFRIKYKDESWEMKLLYLFIWWFCPNFMTSFTTVIGNTIYFPDRDFIRLHENSAMRILAHEFVHLLDAEEWSEPAFMISYLFPQIFAVGVCSFPYAGWYALFFLLFLLPFPAPFRFHFESRAYAIDILTSPMMYREQMIKKCAQYASSWSYYKMFPFHMLAEQQIKKWVLKAEKGEDKILSKILLVYEMVKDV